MEINGTRYVRLICSEWSILRGGDGDVVRCIFCLMLPVVTVAGDVAGRNAKAHHSSYWKEAHSLNTCHVIYAGW